MPRLLPPLNALRAFKVASRTGSFTIAADELCVSQGAVSRHIARLEDYLGASLFDRNHREVKLTEMGAMYAAELQQAFDRIEEATSRVYREKKRQHLTVRLYPTIARSWLMRRLGDFQCAHPTLELHVTCKTGLPNLELGEFDISCVDGPIDDPSLEYRRIVDIVLRPVCSPSFIAEGHVMETAEDLSRHLTLCSINRPKDWDTWLARAGAPPGTAKRTLSFENTALAYQAASAGIGVAMGIMDISDNDPTFGRLIEPFPLKVSTGVCYGLAWRRNSDHRPAIRLFRDWLDQELEHSDFCGSTRSAVAMSDRG